MKIVKKRVASIIVIAILALSFVSLPAYAALTVPETFDTDGDPKTTGDKGDKVVVKGSGVQGGRTVNLYWDMVQDWSASDGAGLLNSSKAKSSGKYEVWFRVPEATNGTHYVYVEDSYTLDWALVEFYVYPKISLSSSSEEHGKDFTVTGNGFSDSADIAIIFNDTAIDTGSVSGGSAFSADPVETEFDGDLGDYVPVIPTTVTFTDGTDTIDCLIC